MTKHPDWSYNSNIYEVNLRQYTAEGTFKAFMKHLPRLKDMGVEILWFMPITPISSMGRKGTLGSYYAVQNYTEANPEFGSVQDFKELVETAHRMDFKIIIDWVANHTGNDNIWIDIHPDFFSYDDTKQLIHPHGWEDVTKLNFDNGDMQDAMVEAMKFWITETGIDGFRCDMAHLVPLQFWKKAKSELDKIKPHLFWLAECEESNYHEVFDATYTWQWMHKTEEYYRQKAILKDLTDLLSYYNSAFTANAFRVYFTSNHDENSWNGTEYEKYNGAAKLLAVFSCTWNGLPMLYSGQEMPNLKRLKFFEKDAIEWTGNFELHNFYKVLFLLRKENNAMRAGDISVSTFNLETNHNENIFAFNRLKDEDSVIVILNFSDNATDVEIKNVNGMFRNIFNNEIYTFDTTIQLNIQAWGYYVFEKAK